MKSITEILEEINSEANQNKLLVNVGGLDELDTLMYKSELFYDDIETDAYMRLFYSKDEY